MFENGSIGKDINTCAEATTTFELKTMLALGTEKRWSVGSVDIITTTRYAELCEDDDGNINVTPPTILARMGLVEESMAWVLKKALYGLVNGF